MATGVAPPVSTDRRSSLRFEILGRLRGSLAAEPTVLLRNISPGGALIQTPWALVPTTVHAVRIETDRHLVTIDARVLHVRPGYTGTDYLIGLEFLASDQAAAAQLDQLVNRPPSADAHFA